jgi:integrase
MFCAFPDASEDATKSAMFCASNAPTERHGQKPTEALRGGSLGGSMAKRKVRRTKSPHPGVRLKKARRTSGSVRYYAVFRDPDTGKERDVTLDATALPTQEARVLWCKRKSAELAARRMDLELGAARANGLTLGEVIETYYREHSNLRPRSLLHYRMTTNSLIAWGSVNGVTLADKLDRAALMRWRADLIARPKVTSVRKGKRGQKAAATQRRSAVTVNKDLRQARAVLGYLTDRDLLARCSYDDLRRALKKLKTERNPITFLRAPDIATLLRVAMAHDATHKNVAPLIAAAALTGARIGELVGSHLNKLPPLDWSAVDLEANGRRGEIRLAGSSTKTHDGRIIDLGVSPAQIGRASCRERVS